MEMRRLFSYVMLFLFCVVTLLPTVVEAASNCPTNYIQRPQRNTGAFEIGTCAASYTGINYEDWEFTTKLVDCIEGTIRDAVLRMMDVISTEFGWVVSVLSTLVVMFYGVRTATGEKELLKRTATLAIKLAFVALFMNMLPTVVDWVFAIFKELLALVVGGISPWQRIDIFLGNLVGFGPSILLLNGVMGLVGAAAFSSNVGLTMFFFGIIGILNLLTFILSVIYTYLLAFLTIGFLLIFLPIMIPLGLFFYTERYFRKWVDIIVSAILTPVLLFAFLWMFIGVFDILIQNIFDILGGNDFKAYWRMNTSLFSWMMPSDPNANVLMTGIPRNEDIPCVQRIMRAPVQGNINPLARNSFDAGTLKTATLNFGANDVNIVQKLSYAFMTLWLFSSLMKSMVHLLPQVASSIASVSSNIAFGGNSAIVGRLQQAIGQTQSSLQSGLASGDTKFNTISSFSSQMANMLGRRDK